MEMEARLQVTAADTGAILDCLSRVVNNVGFVSICDDTFFVNSCTWRQVYRRKALELHRPTSMM
eukprot:6994256-Ditylum_brightwellii.AAC.1